MTENNLNDLNKTNRLIPFKIKVGYAMGGTGDAIAYDFIGSFLFAAVINIGSAGHWTLSYTLLYDIYEIDEFKNGKRREGFLMAFFSFCGKLGGAAAGSITGWILQFAHYDATAATQTPEALAAIKSLFTFWPGLFCLAAGFVILLYPVTRPRFELLLKNLELKRQGKEYSTEGFEKLIR